MTSGSRLGRVSCSNCLTRFPAAQTLYGFVGFPGSENQALPDYKFQMNSFYYGGQPANDVKYARLGYDRRTHFIMNFERDRMTDHAGNQVEVPEPYGMSGGPVFKLGTFAEIDSGAARPRVIAATIEWWEKLEVLVGVRISLLSEAIRQLLPPNAEELPDAPHFRSDVTLANI